MIADKEIFRNFLFDMIDDKVESVIFNTKANNQKVLLEIFKPLLPIACILLHLKACNGHNPLACSDILQYTLLPSINNCDDYSFLANCEFKPEAI